MPHAWLRVLNPRLHQSTELLSALEKLCRFGRCSYLYSCVVDDVALAPAAIEEQHQSISLFPKRQGGTFKTESMMAWNSRDTVSGTGRRHSRHLQGCVVGRCESAILRKCRERCVSQIPSDHSAKLIEFLLARLVRVNLPSREQFLPTHLLFLPTLSSCFAGPSAGSDFSRQPSWQTHRQRKQSD